MKTEIHLAKANKEQKNDVRIIMDEAKVTMRIWNAEEEKFVEADVILWELQKAKNGLAYLKA